MAKDENTADAEDMMTLPTKGPAALIVGNAKRVGMTCVGDTSLSGGCKHLIRHLADTKIHKVGK